MLEMTLIMSFLFFLVAMGDRGDFFFLFGQIFFGWDGRLRQSFFGTSGFRYRYTQESFYPGRTVFSRKLFFNTRTELQKEKSQQYDDYFLTFFFFFLEF